jgi:glycosyltransferase involved in cell wall biosynthesis
MKPQLETIKTSSAENILRGRDIICFSHDWSGDPLSKTHIVRVLSRDNRVLWINALANRMPTASNKDFKRIFKKLAAFTEPVKEVEKNIFVLNPLAIPAYGTTAVRSFNQRFLLSQVRGAMRKLNFQRPVNMVFNPAAGMVAGKLNEENLIYYCVDEYTAFTGASKGLKEIEEDLFRKADVVIVSAEKLLESKARLNPKTFLIRHGVDYTHFAKALSEETPVPQILNDLPRPIIGFHGLLADWIDYDLLKKVAEHFQNGSLVLIGKITVDGEKHAAKIKDLPNMHFLGRKPYTELPGYCKGFDVALNPFAINELTLAANPLKVREYLAAGVPVVSTAIPEVEVLGTCRIGHDAADFIRQIELSLGEPREQRSERSASVRHESWEARVDELRRIIFDSAVPQAEVI